MKHIFYGIGTVLSILSVFLFMIHPRDHRLDLSFSLYWCLVVILLIFDCRNEYLRRERIHRNITTSNKRGFMRV